MEMDSQFEYQGKMYKSHWVEDDPMVNLGKTILHGVHGICFYGDKIVIVFHPTDDWTLPGGGIEYGETPAEAIVREIKEETNMKVLHVEYIGYQDAWDATSPDGEVGRDARYFCIVEPYGDFVSDPDGDITEIKLIDPKDYKQYFD